MAMGRKISACMSGHGDLDPKRKFDLYCLLPSAYSRVCPVWCFLTLGEEIPVTPGHRLLRKSLSFTSKPSYGTYDEQCSLCMRGNRQFWHMLDIAVTSLTCTREPSFFGKYAHHTARQI